MSLALLCIWPALPRRAKRCAMRHLCLLPIALAACNTAGDSGVSSDGTALSGDYQLFTSTNAVTSTVSGAAIQLTSTPNDTQVVGITGTMTHDTGATTLDDGTYELVDTDGFSPNGLLTDGISALAVTPVQGFSTSYSYMRAYKQGYITNGTAYSTEGVFGIATQPADMPTSGGATWAGEAEGTFETSAGITDLDNGTASVTANFASRTVTVRMDGFDTVSRSTGQNSPVGFDAVQISAMDITGNAFSGGTITAQNGNTPISVVGTRQKQSASGRFFGLTAAGTPDEVGGVGYLRGADGTLSTIFMAD